MAATGVPKRASVGVVAATVAGNAIEFYDFLCFSYFAAYISKAFFPGGDPYADLLKTLAVFWAGFLLRPIGGIVIGAYADRVGRRPAMMLTIGLITLGTMGLAFIPSYASIGVAAPILLVLFRFVQGFALGGEVGPASVFLIESAPPGRRGFYASWQIASQGLAGVAGGIVSVGLSLSLSAEDMQNWGWRVPFMLCLALIPIAVYLRRDMPETVAAAPASTGAGLASNAGYIALGVMLIIGGTVSTYVGLYMATYAIMTLQLPKTLSLSATLVGGLATFSCALIGGWLGDRVGRKAMVAWPRVALMVLIWPLFLLMAANPSAATLWLATAATAGLTALSAGIGLVILPELLPNRARATGFAVSYALGVSLFGGSTQFVIAWLIQATGNPAAPAWYVIATSFVTLAALMALPETKGRDIG